MAELNFKELVNPISKEITYHYNNLWKLFISCVKDAVNENTTTRLTRQQVIDYLFNLYIFFDYDNGELVTDFDTDGSRGTGSYFGFGIKNGTDSYILLPADPTYISDIEPIRDIYNILQQDLALSSFNTFNRKLITEYIEYPVDEIQITGNNTDYTTYNATDPEIVYVNFWYFLLTTMNLFIQNDFHITFSQYSDTFQYHNIKTIDVPSVATIEAFAPTTGTTRRIGLDDTMCNMYLSDFYSDSYNFDIADLVDLNCMYSISNFGIATTINTNLLARDFQASKQELINYVSKYYPDLWNNFYDSDVGTIFLDIFSYVNDILNNYVDRMLRESSPLYSQEPTTIKNWADFFGIEVPGAISAVTQAKYLINVSDLKDDAGNVLTGITKGDKIVYYPSYNSINSLMPKYSINGFDFNYFTANETDNETEAEADYASDDSYAFVLPLVEGSYKKDSFTAVGSDFETFVTNSFPVASLNFKVFLGGVEKKMVPSFEALESLQTDADGVYSFLANGNLQIMFGNSVLGTQTTKGSIVDIVYLTSKGELGNSVAKNALADETMEIAVYHGTPTPTVYTGEATVIANTASAGGQTVQLSNKDMILFTLMMQSNGSLDTEDHINAFLNTYIGKNGGRLKGKVFLLQDDESANVVLLPILIPASEKGYTEFEIAYDTVTESFIYPAIITELLAEIDKRKMLTDRFEVISGIIQKLDFYVDLTITHNLPRTEIENKIRDAIKEYFYGIDFNKNGKLSDLYYEVESILREYSPNDYLSNFCKIYWRYKGDTADRTETSIIEWNYDKLTTDQQNRLITIFGTEELARTNGQSVSLFGIDNSDIAFTSTVTGYKKAKLNINSESLA